MIAHISKTSRMFVIVPMRRCSIQRSSDVQQPSVFMCRGLVPSAAFIGQCRIHVTIPISSTCFRFFFSFLELVFHISSGARLFHHDRNALLAFSSFPRVYRVISIGGNKLDYFKFWLGVSSTVVVTYGMTGNYVQMGLVYFARFMAQWWTWASIKRFAVYFLSRLNSCLVFASSLLNF